MTGTKKTHAAPPCNGSFNTPNSTRILFNVSGLLCGLLFPLISQATLGLFEHGSGIKSLGEGGISFVAGEESTAIPANPALAIALGRRFDVGDDLLAVSSRASILGNSLGPDKSYDADARHLYFIPQAGFTLPLSPRWSAGISAYAGGLGPDYTQSPFARFATSENAAQSQSTSIALKVTGLSMVLAYSPIAGQAFGVAVNAQRETIAVKGLAPFESASQSPGELTDVGKHGAYGGSLSVGWTGELTPWLTGGASYRSKSWSQHITQYGGLLPDNGLLELPAIYGAALAFKPIPRLQVALQFERADYGSRHAFGNTVDVLFVQGKPLGSDNGPGFGWLDQNNYKLGVSYDALARLRLRAGFIYSTANFPPSQTFFNILAPATYRMHFTTGGTWTFPNRFELSMYAALARKHDVNGRNSIPENYGGGEVNLSSELYLVGVSIGRPFNW